MKSFRGRDYLLVMFGLFMLVASPARAAGLDAKESEDFRQARQLYKSGNYQEAADIFSRLSAAHPDMPTLARNAGAAYYYLKRPDPSLSNLREYLRVQKKFETGDREEVEQWIAEMEQLRAQSQSNVPAAAVSLPPAGPGPVGVPPQPGMPGQPGFYPPTAAPGNSFMPTSPAAGGPAATSAPPAGAPPANYYAPAPGYGPPAYGYPPAAPVAAPPPAGPVAAPPPADGTVAGPAAPSVPPSGYGYPPISEPAPQAGATVPPVQAGVAKESLPPPKAGKGAAPWIIGGAGVVALGLGGAFTYLYRQAYDDTRAKYDPNRESQGRTFSYLQFVGYGLGAAGITTAVILLLSGDHGKPNDSVSVAPALGARFAGAELTAHY
jgi:hypothetical protein